MIAHSKHSKQCRLARGVHGIHNAHSIRVHGIHSRVDSNGFRGVGFLPKVYQLPDKAVIALTRSPVIIHPVLGSLPDADGGTGFILAVTLAPFPAC
jgi:hypothetical protein